MSDEPKIAHPPLVMDEIDLDVLEPTRSARPMYWAWVIVLGLAVLYGTAWWVAQAHLGMQLTGLSTPIGWSFYVTNFVFWVGIGHAGTLISAILFLVRSRWRKSIARSAEAMTVFAVMTAGLFPLIHLGRVWVFYYILPYPSERQLWPNFISPLVWDVCAISTYLTVSIIFWYIGLLPDLATARAWWTKHMGPDHPRTKFYRRFSLGWSGAGGHWRHYGRGYLFFAALATPLVVSVHSVVSWDFAMGNLPGWHVTLFAPYFVAGAIHSGLAMVLTLLIPMRRILKLDRVITMDHFESVALMMILTTLIVGYAYAIEPFISWYSGDTFEQQFAFWRATGWIAPFFWALTAFNVLAPLTFLFRRMRRSLVALFIVSILVNIGMWLERFVIIAGSESHDFLPHNWHTYAPRPVELSITLAGFSFFLFWFFMFSKHLPAVSITDLKEHAAEPTGEALAVTCERPTTMVDARRETTGVTGVFRTSSDLLLAIRRAQRAGFDRLETFTPVNLPEVEKALGRPKSPVRRWTLIGALSGLVGGFALAIGTGLVNNLIVGGKHAVSIAPYCIVGFEGLILCGALANFAAVLWYCRLGRSKLPPGYDDRFVLDRFGLMIGCGKDRAAAAVTVLKEAGAEEAIRF